MKRLRLPFVLLVLFVTALPAESRSSSGGAGLPKRTETTLTEMTIAKSRVTKPLIGLTKAEVQQMLGKPNSVKGNVWHYTNAGDGPLALEFKGGKVSRVLGAG